MTAQILDGNAVAKSIKDSLNLGGLKPRLAVLLVGDDPASEVYVAHKQRACEEVGIATKNYQLSADATHDEVLERLDWCNKDWGIHGILVQLPLPPKFSRNYILKHIAEKKDVDCLHPLNIGRMVQNDPLFCPCTPGGIIELFKFYNIKTKGKHVVIVNRGIVVGQPLVFMLSQNSEWGNATVTVCHEYTANLGDVCSQADILISAVGKKDFFITADMVKRGAVVIDVGIYREEGRRKIRGDVLDEVRNKAAAVTPVPGGVGPCTIAMLLKNTIDACRRLS